MIPPLSALAAKKRLVPKRRRLRKKKEHCLCNLLCGSVFVGAFAPYPYLFRLWAVRVDVFEQSDKSLESKRFR
jgi:hypothetical protein